MLYKPSERTNILHLFNIISVATRKKVSKQWSCFAALPFEKKKLSVRGQSNYSIVCVCTNISTDDDNCVKVKRRETLDIILFVASWCLLTVYAIAVSLILLICNSTKSFDMIFMFYGDHRINGALFRSKNSFRVIKLYFCAFLLWDNCCLLRFFDALKVENIVMKTCE